MTNVLYTSVSVQSYNSNPPADDGTETVENRITWSKHKTKLGDPLKTAIEAINTNVTAAFGKAAFNDAVTVTTDYTTIESDWGKILRCTSALTLTLLDAVTAEDGHVLVVWNDTTASDVTIDGNASETVNGAATLVLPPGSFWFGRCDGTSWRGPVGIFSITAASQIKDGILTYAKAASGQFATAAQGTKADSAQQAAIGSQAEIEAETSEKLLDGANAKYHPGVAAAWVNFGGAGTVAINDSHNVSSITDNGTGNYDINLSVTMSSVNYVTTFSATSSGGGSSQVPTESSTAVRTTTSYRMNSWNVGTQTLNDPTMACTSVLGDLA